MGTIVASSRGFRDASWWPVLLAHLHGTMNADDHVAAHSLQVDTGYTLPELARIEAAFEGDLLTPGQRRLSQFQGTAVLDRLLRTFEVLLELDGHDVGQAQKLFDYQHINT